MGHVAECRTVRVPMAFVGRLMMAARRPPVTRRSFHAMVVQSAKAAKAAGAASTAEIRDFTSVDQLPRQDPHSTVVRRRRPAGVASAPSSERGCALSQSTRASAARLASGRGRLSQHAQLQGWADRARKAGRRQGVPDRAGHRLCGHRALVARGGLARGRRRRPHRQQVRPRVACQAEWLVPVPAPFSAADASERRRLARSGARVRDGRAAVDRARATRARAIPIGSILRHTATRTAAILRGAGRRPPALSSPAPELCRPRAVPRLS
eukprot:3103134-Prymnesium_polylepis.1